MLYSVKIDDVAHTFEADSRRAAVRTAKRLLLADGQTFTCRKAGQLDRSSINEEHFGLPWPYC